MRIIYVNPAVLLLVSLRPSTWSGGTVTAATAALGTKESSSAVNDIGLVLYTDVTPANTTDSLLRIRHLPLKNFEFKYDSVAGRRQIGVLGQDAQKYFPEAVEIVPNYPIRNLNIVLHNFPVVDKNVIFIHGVAALQELIKQFDELKQTLDVAERLGATVASELISVRDKFSEEECSQKILHERIESLEEQILLKSSRLNDLLVDERLKLAERDLEDQRELLRYEQELSKERMVLEEERIKAELDASIAAERLALEAKERMRRETEEALLKRRVELEAELERDKARIEEEGIRAEIAAKAEQERLNEDVVLRRMQLQASLDTQKLVKSIAAVGAQAAMLSRDLVEQPMRLAYLLAIVLGVFAAYYAIKEGVALLRAVVQARLGRPSLVRETSLGLGLPLVLTWSYWLPERTSTGIRRAQGLFEDIILSEHDKGSVVNLAVATRNSKRNGIPYRHVLLYGPPGTGKTLIARRIAMSSGMDYAIMSGGDVGPLGEDAVTQLHGLFRWAARSSRGLVVFVDEAEAFLSARSGGAGAGDDVHRRHALNALLYQTGTQSKAFMLILATNRPEDLDSAVLDRIDVSLCVGMPEERERAQLIRLYHAAHFQDIEHRVSYLSKLFGRGAKKLKSFKLDDATVASIAASTAGFSGREISKVFIAMQYAVLLTQDKTLTESMMRGVLEAKLKEHEDMARFLGHRSGKEQASIDVGVNDDSESATVNDSVAATGRTPKRSVPQRPVPAASGRTRRRSAAEHTVPSEEG